jgi:hypothetical protein
MSFLTGWMAGDLATRKDQSGKVDSLRGDLELERQQAENSHDFSMAAVGALVGWKATAHNLRARLIARRETEAELLEQLTAADMRVPLCDPEVFDKRNDEIFAKKYTDPAVVSETYDGELPPALAEEIEDWKKKKGIE